MKTHVTLAAFALLLSTTLQTTLFAQVASTNDAEKGSLPLKPTRIIEFTTDEVTNLSVDISPDGKTIVFDALGDLYTLPITGGTARPLTRGMAWDEAPRFSPDGKQIAFVSDRNGMANLWVMQADGTEAHRVTRWTDVNDTAAPEFLKVPVWTPDGRAIIALRLGGAESARGLSRYDLRTGRGVKIPDRGNLCSGASVTAEKQVLYANCNYSGQAPAQGLSLVDEEAQSPRQLAGPMVQALHPAVSPDGRWVAYQTMVMREPFEGLAFRRYGLRLRDLAAARESSAATPSSVQDLLLVPKTESCLLPCTARGHAFTPDGRALVYVSEGKLQRIDLATQRVTPIPFTVPVRAELGPLVAPRHRLDDGPIAVRQLHSVRPSPDGAKFGFSALGKLWVQEGRGRPRPLTTSALHEHDPVFSPDGQWIAYVTWSDAEGGQLMKVPVAGGPAVVLAQDPVGYFFNPGWSPDGQRLVFLYSAAGFEYAGEAELVRRHKVATVAAAGGTVRHVTPEYLDLQSRSQLGKLSLRADGLKAYVIKKTSGSDGGELLAVDLESGGVEVLARLNGVVDLRAVPSPDGKWLALTVSKNIALLPMPIAQGGRVPEIQVTGPAADRSILRLTTEGGIDPAWSADGRTLTWTWANHVAQMSLADVLAARGAVKPRTTTIDLTVPRPLPKGTVVLRGARLVTMAPDGAKTAEVIPQGDVVIAGRRIVGVGPTGTLRIPAGATVLDVSGATIVPGFIDTHAHKLALSHLLPDQEPGYSAALAMGITSLRDPGAGYQRLAYEEAVEAGALVGPRWVGGLQLFAPHHGEAVLEGARGADEAVRKHVSAGAQVIKMYTGNPHRLRRQWLVQAARRHGVHITADENGSAGGWQGGLTDVLDGYSGVEHGAGTLYLNPAYRDVTQLLGRSGTTFALFGYPSEERFVQANDRTDWSAIDRFWGKGAVEAETRFRDATAASLGFSRPAPAIPTSTVWQRITAYHALEHKELRDVIRAGGGSILRAETDKGREEPRIFHLWIWRYTSIGASPAEALRFATLNGARGLGFEADLGSIELGKIADLVVLNRNPLEDITATADARYVVKDGVVYQARTLDTIWPEKKAFPPLGGWRVLPLPPLPAATQKRAQ